MKHRGRKIFWVGNIPISQGVIDQLQGSVNRSFTWDEYLEGLIKQAFMAVWKERKEVQDGKM